MSRCETYDQSLHRPHGTHAGHRARFGLKPGDCDGPLWCTFGRLRRPEWGTDAPVIYQCGSCHNLVAWNKTDLVLDVHLPAGQPREAL